MAQDDERVASIDFDWKNPYSGSKLSRAIQSGNFDLVKKLIKKGCSLDMPDNRGLTPLHEAATDDKFADIVRLLISAGAYIHHKTVEGETPLFLACKHQSEVIVETLLNAGCEVNTHNNECLTPLHVAASCGNGNILRLLLENNADINAKDDEERSPLYLALKYVNISALRLLIEAGADLKMTDFFSRTPLQYACMIGNVEVFDILIEHLGRDKSIIDGQTPEGWTLLMEACQYKSYLIAQKLIEYGTDTTLVDNRGLLALHIAAHCERYNLIELLLKHTPKEAIEKYSTFGANMTHYRSLPCLIIDKIVFEGLELLFNSGLSEEVLKCPAKMGDRLVSPISFLLLHAKSIENEEKLNILEFLLSYQFMVEPIYENDDEYVQDSEWYNDPIKHSQNVVSPVEAAVQLHRPVHNDCYCDKFLCMILAKGAYVDKVVPNQGKTLFSQYVHFHIAARYGFTAGLELLLCYSECIEPDDVMDMLIKDIAEPHHLWTDQETNIVKFLLDKTTTDFFPAVLSIKNSLSSPSRPDDFTRLKAVLPIYNLVASHSRISSLKRISRVAFRKYVRQQAQASSKSFRKYISNIDLPTYITKYLLYEVDF